MTHSDHKTSIHELKVISMLLTANFLWPDIREALSDQPINTRLSFTTMNKMLISKRDCNLQPSSVSTGNSEMKMDSFVSHVVKLLISYGYNQGDIMNALTGRPANVTKDLNAMKIVMSFKPPL